MAKEQVKTLDGKEIEINCRILTPRKAEQILENSINISELIPTTIEVTDEKTGETKVKESQKLVGDYSGIISLKSKALDFIIEECPQKEEIDVESRNNIYEKYGKKILDQTFQEALSPN